jgi:hypothetical protein
MRSKAHPDLCPHSALCIAALALAACSSSSSAAPDEAQDAGHGSGPSGHDAAPGRDVELRPDGGSHALREAGGAKDAPTDTVTALDARTEAGGATSAAIKWNPGHYMASDGIVSPGATIANSDFLPYELGAIQGFDDIVGYRMFITWASLESGYGVYDFSLVTSVLSYLETQLGTPRHLVVVVLPGQFSSTAPGTSYSVVPEYILTDPQYGPSPVAGSYGWWGGSNNGNTWAAALHRLAAPGQESVNDRWIKLHQALGNAFNSEPYFEAIMFQEDSWVVGAAANDHDPTWSEANYVTNLESTLTATLAAFPNTSVIEENSYLETATPTQDFEQWMIQHRVAPGAADTFGQTYITANHGVPNGWGMSAYFGLTASGSTYSGPDYRPTMPSMVDVEGPDLACFGGSGYTPQDICDALNMSYHSSHAFWTYCGTPPAAKWSTLATTLQECPLVNTGYPANYPN